VSAASRRQGPRAGAFACRLALAAAALAPSCARADSPAERALAELEELAFVPAGRVPVGALVPIVLYECPAPLLVDRFEVTRARWAEFAAERPDDLSSEMLARVRAWGASLADVPATWMTQIEAQRYADWRGMRLLAPGEWLFAALGQERRLFPWRAYERQDSIANTLDLGLGVPCPVGTFEGGRTPGQVYDLLGNVAEWVAGDVLTGLARGPADAGELDAEREVSALGGSFRTWLRPIYRSPRAGEPSESPFLAYSLHPRSRQDDVGLRCAMPAQPYLERTAALWADDARTQDRLRAVGERWGRSAVPLLRDLVGREGAAPGLMLLLEGAQR
jgi:formylglycine-generating enzyme required for sulfatase activity